MIPLAVAGAAALGHVDEFGYLHLPDGWRIEWWIAGDDHWHVPAASASLRQRSIDNTPVVETVMRVPGGDVVWRAAATATAEGGALVTELENRASIPVAIGVALIAPEQPSDVLVRPSLRFTTPARSVAAELGVELLVHPVTHGSTFRCSVGATPPDALPPIDAIVRGWLALARQGAEIALGDPTVDESLLAARTSLMLHHGSLVAAGRRQANGTAAAVATALTFLGYETEAEQLRVAARLRPKRKGLPTVAPIEPVLETDAREILADAAVAAATVAEVRALTIDDRQRRQLDVLPRADDAWRGRSVDVANLPTDHGPVSFALRWHGDKPALLWDAPKKATLRATGLAKEWSTKQPTGEELLTEL